MQVIFHQCSDISNIDITELDVEQALSSLKNIIQPGSDGTALKNCSLSVSYPLCYLFKKSLSLGQFLDQCKISELMPIYKSGSKQDMTNYRPISKLVVIPKLFEQIVCGKISPLINGFLSDEQHGLRRGLSTSTNLAVFSNFVNVNFNSNAQTDVKY